MHLAQAVYCILDCLQNKTMISYLQSLTMKSTLQIPLGVSMDSHSDEHASLMPKWPMYQACKLSGPDLCL